MRCLNKHLNNDDANPSLSTEHETASHMNAQRSNSVKRDIPDIEWIFGYGSLMWRPGFYHLEQHPARLHGYHRAACIYSRHHRGTDTVPGLVLGLDTGEYCDGIAFKIDIKHRMQIIDYLHQRELIGYAYTPLTTPVTLPHAEVSAYTFVADPAHPHYAGNLGTEAAAAIIMRAQGSSGLNRDYLISTVEKLAQDGVAEPELTELLTKVRVLTGELDQGGGI